MTSVAIIILNWNGKENTIACLQSLQDLEIKEIEVEIIVVDNASEEEFKIQNSKFKNLTTIRNKENLGFAGGNNVGIRYALERGVDYIVVLNNDTIVDKHFLSAMIQEAQKHEDFGIASSKIYFAKGFEFHKDKYKNHEKGKVIWYAGGIFDWKNILGSHRGVDEVDRGQFEKVETTDFASGCCMLIKAEVFKKLGLFDEKYFLYYEDVDLSIRAKNAGFTIFYIPQSIIWHKNAGSAGGSGSKLQDYYITRNRLLFGMQYASLRAKLALLKEGIKLLFVGRKEQKKGARDFFLKRFWKGNV